MTTILEQAAAIVDTDREKTYGEPGKNLRAIAEMLNTAGDAHGTRNAYERLRCRCDICKASNAARHKARRAKIKTE